MATRKPAARKTNARKRPAKKPTAAQTRRKKLAARPARKKGVAQRIGRWLALRVAAHAEAHRHTVRARKDAAILRATHAGCETCHGTGTLYTKDKHGKLSGSKPCPAKPATTKVSKARVHTQARFGVDKHSGLIGWKCPCGTKEKPRFRDAKTATKALRTHEQKKHGGVSVGGAWYAQVPEPSKPTAKTPEKSSRTGPAPWA